MGDLFKQAQVLQSKLAELQEQAERRTVEASSGGGMVTVAVNGKLHVLKVHIEPQVLTGGDREMLEDLVTAAVNEAGRKADEAMQGSMGQMLGGMDLGGMFS